MDKREEESSIKTQLSVTTKHCTSMNIKLGSTLYPSLHTQPTFFPINIISAESVSHMPGGGRRREACNRWKLGEKLAKILVKAQEDSALSITFRSKIKKTAPTYFHIRIVKPPDLQWLILVIWGYPPQNVGPRSLSGPGQPGGQTEDVPILRVGPCHCLLY